MKYFKICNLKLRKFYAARDFSSNLGEFLHHMLQHCLFHHIVFETLKDVSGNFPVLM